MACANRGLDAVRTASKSKMRPPTSIIPGDESRRRREGAAAPRDAGLCLDLGRQITRRAHEPGHLRVLRRGDASPSGRGAGLISASRGAAVPSRRRRDSCPSDEVVGGFFFDFGCIRTESSDRDAPRRHRHPHRSTRPSRSTRWSSRRRHPLRGMNSPSYSKSSRPRLVRRKRRQTSPNNRKKRLSACGVLTCARSRGNDRPWRTSTSSRRPYTTTRRGVILASSMVLTQCMLKLVQGDSSRRRRLRASSSPPRHRRDACLASRRVS